MWKETFNYTGKTQVLDIAPCSLHNETFPTPYLLECWGAQGYDGDAGNYVKGILTIKKPIRLYLNVGGEGGLGEEKYGWYSDGQGYSSYYDKYGYRCSGGSTDISLVGIENDTVFNRTDHLNNILLRAQGGNGSSYTDSVSLACPTGTRSCNLTGQTTHNPSVTNNSTSYSGYISGTSGKSNAPIVLTVKPDVDGTLTFYSDNKTAGDPYGYITGAVTTYNDDGNGNNNFKITISVTAGSTYYLRCGSYSDTSPSTYNWYATYPSSTVTTSNTFSSSTVYTGANGTITNALGTSGNTVLYITPKVSGTLRFYSTNKTAGDPYGRITSNGYSWTNDNSNGNNNFLMSVSVNANRTYYLYCGSTRNSTTVLGSPPISSYSWYATFPQSTVSRYTSNFTNNYTYNWTVTGGVNNYPDIINEDNIIGLSLSDTQTYLKNRSGNGLIKITRLSPIPKNTNFRYDAISQEAFDYGQFLDYINTI